MINKFLTLLVPCLILLCSLLTINANGYNVRFRGASAPGIGPYSRYKAIRPMPCRSSNSVSSGVCMFSFDCMQQRGTPIGVCMDSIYVGSCCRLAHQSPPEPPKISSNKTSSIMKVPPLMVSDGIVTPSLSLPKSKPSTTTTTTTQTSSSTQTMPSSPPSTRKPMPSSSHPSNWPSSTEATTRATLDDIATESAEVDSTAASSVIGTVNLTASTKVGSESSSSTVPPTVSSVTEANVTSSLSTLSSPSSTISLVDDWPTANGTHQVTNTSAPLKLPSSPPTQFPVRQTPSPSSLKTTTTSTTTTPSTPTASTTTTTTTTTEKPTSPSTTTTTTTTTTTPAPTTPSTTTTTTTAGPTKPPGHAEICGRKPKTPKGRIVGGSQSSFSEWPWMVSLRQWKKNAFLHKCGAALLNNYWAVTAAHCVENVAPNDLLLRLGEYDVSHENEALPYVERRVQIIAPHPEFDPRTFEYDLALLRFYEPVHYRQNIVPVCLPSTNDTFIGKWATVTGWGRLYEDGPLPDTMQHVSVPVINNRDCETMYRRAGYIEDIPNIFICAGLSKGGKDSCEGDSGGPLVYEKDDKFELIGIISWGIGCALPNQPGVYTRITEFYNWIHQIVAF